MLILFYDNKSLIFDKSRLVFSLIVFVFFGSGIWIYFILETKVIELSDDMIAIKDVLGFRQRTYRLSEIANLHKRTNRIKGRVASSDPFEELDITFEDNYELTLSQNMYSNYHQLKAFIYKQR